MGASLTGALFLALIVSVSVLRQKLRHFLLRFGYDFHRVGGAALGRNYAADLDHFCGTVKNIFDVGANTGRSVFRFREDFPGAEIHSFEPFPEAYEKLVESTRNLPGVHRYQLALGAAESRQTLYTSAGSELNSLIPTASGAGQFLDPKSLAPRKDCEVDVTTIDLFRAKHPGKHIDLLKIDTQGTELNVLRGAEQTLRAGAITAIYLEVNFVPLYDGQCSFHDLLSLLEPLGYRFTAFYDPAFAEGGYLKWADAIFVRAPIDGQTPEAPR